MAGHHEKLTSGCKHLIMISDNSHSKYAVPRIIPGNAICARCLAERPYHKPDGPNGDWVRIEEDRMPIDGETQLIMLKQLLAPAAHYMEMSDFGDALTLACERFTEYATDICNPERGNWWHCMTIIHASAQLRFGDKPWLEYLKRNPKVFTVKGDNYHGER